MLHDPTELRAFLLQNFKLPFRFIYQPTHGDRLEHFNQFCDLARKCKRMTLCIDEADAFMSASEIKSAVFRDIINYSRHYKLALVMTSRRPQQVAREVTSQCSELRVFRMNESRDIAYFSEQLGSDSDAIALKDLEKYQYLRWHDDGRPVELVKK